MPMMRFVLALCVALLPPAALAQIFKPPACPARPADCQVSVQVFDFGRAPMSPSSPPINGQNTVSVTCTRVNQKNLDVRVDYELKAVPPELDRRMRDLSLHDLLYGLFVNATRTRYWGDGSSGTSTFSGDFRLNDRNSVDTRVHQIYGRVDGGQLLTPPGQYLGLVLVRLEYEPKCN